LTSFFRDLRERDRLAGWEPATDHGHDLEIASSIESPDLAVEEEVTANCQGPNLLAAKLLGKALGQTPNDPEAWLALGYVLW